jgi:hypothetical protein
MSDLVQLLLLLFILNLGVALGAGLYETKLIVPLWFPKSDEFGYEVNRQTMKQLDAGRAFWAFVSTGPLTLLTTANLVLAWQSQPPTRSWWLAAALMALTERVATFSFFIPTVLKLQQSTHSSAKIGHLVGLWIGFNYIRHALTLLACVSAL